MPRSLSLAAIVALAASAAVSQESEPRPVKLIPIEKEQSVIERQFFGQVVARQTVDLAFQVNGQIVELPVIEGERLSAGGLIAQLDLEPFTLQLDQAIVEQEQANRTLERQRTLGAGTVSQAAIDDAETAAELAAIAVRNAEFALEQATLRAPFDALVANRNVANFTTVSAGTPVVRIHDMSELRVQIEVPEILFRRAQNQEVLDLIATFPGSDTKHPLEIREFQAETSSVGQTYTVTLGMAPPDDPSIIPGASAIVVGRRPTGQSMILVPPTAVVIAPDRSTRLMVFEPGEGDTGTVRSVDVQLATHLDGSLEMVEGPEPGAEIVATGAMALSDGQRVRRFTGFGN